MMAEDRTLERLRQQQDLFAEMMLSDKATEAARLEAFAALLAVPEHGPSAPARATVYQRSYRDGMVGVLSSLTPAVEQWVGAAFFAQLSQAYACSAPPQAAALLSYGTDFPDFIKTFPGADTLPWLASVAEWEIARHRAYHAAEAPYLDPASLQALPPEAFAQLRFSFHPTLRMFQSPWPVLSLWRYAAAADEISADEGVAPWPDPDTPPDVSLQPCFLTVHRPQAALLTVAWPETSFYFLEALKKGLTVSEAMIVTTDHADKTNTNFDLQGCFAACLRWGVFEAFDQGHASEDEMSDRN